MFSVSRSLKARLVRKGGEESKYAERFKFSFVIDCTLKFLEHNKKNNTRKTVTNSTLKNNEQH